jgi:SAM-dependent methyltransferase
MDNPNHPDFYNTELLPHSAPAGKPALQVIPTPTEQNNTCVFLNTYYEKFLTDHYRSNPNLRNASYQVQKSSLQSTCFGDCDFYSKGLMKAGWRSQDLIVNCNLLQESWNRENACNCEGLSIAIEQIRRLRPQVVYLQDLGIATRDFLAAIRPHVTLIVGQIASPIPPQADLAGFDIIISSFPHFVARLRQAGITAYYQPLAFDPLILDKIGHCRKSYPVTFVGGISPVHGKGTELLEQLARLTPLEFWGYGADTLASGSPISNRHHGEIWGLEMFRLLAQSGITINRHIDVAENYANNMRLFEATGCGALLITDYKDNLNDLFEIGKEIVVYRSVEECASLINYYLAHPAAADEIAKAGQARTLRDHKYDQRMKQTAEILSRHLRYRSEKDLFAPLDTARISYGHTPIAPAEITSAMTSAWQDIQIPIRQRALVQQELDSMYHGEVPIPFQVLADILRPFIRPGIELLEIGCASGYYYETLEYLLNARIKYTGADYSSPLVSMARDYYPQATFHVADGADLPFPDASFDMVVSSGVLLHVPNYTAHIAETVRVARELIAVHRTPVCRNRQTNYMKKFAYGVETVELIFNENEILSDFTALGLELIGMIEYHSNPAQDEYGATYLFRKKR